MADPWKENSLTLIFLYQISTNKDSCASLILSESSRTFQCRHRHTYRGSELVSMKFSIEICLLFVVLSPTVKHSDGIHRWLYFHFQETLLSKTEPSVSSWYNSNRQPVIVSLIWTHDSSLLITQSLCQIFFIKKPRWPNQEFLLKTFVRFH